MTKDNSVGDWSIDGAEDTTKIPLGDIKRLGGEDCAWTGTEWQCLFGRDPKRAITTAMSNRLFWPLEPRVEDIRIEDIAQGLANECRFANQIPHHYPVAWHCVALSNVVPSHLRKWALIHDAAEAYLIDFPRPIKNIEPFKTVYQEAETRLMKEVAKFFNMEENEVPEELEFYDSAMGAAELMYVFKHGIGEAKVRLAELDSKVIEEAKTYKNWILERRMMPAKQIWLARCCELFGHGYS